MKRDLSWMLRCRPNDLLTYDVTPSELAAARRQAARRAFFTSGAWRQIKTLLLGVLLFALGLATGIVTAAATWRLP